MITVTIDGRQVVLEMPVTILEAARRLDIIIPTLCNHEILEPYGGCRLCLVEIEKTPRLQTACTQYVIDGMVIHTESEAVIEARRSVLEFMLIKHPLDCPVCDKAGECKLQDAVANTARRQEGLSGTRGISLRISKTLSSSGTCRDASHARDASGCVTVSKVPLLSP